MANLDTVANDAIEFLRLVDRAITPVVGGTFRLPNHGDIVSCPLTQGSPDTIRYCNIGCPNRARVERLLWGDDTIVIESKLNHKRMCEIVRKYTGGQPNRLDGCDRYEDFTKTPEYTGVSPVFD